jgi:drug/metabolite transporter (DMT)-like permease
MAQARISNRDFAISVALVLVGTACIAAISLLGKELTGALGVSAAIFLRFFVPFVLLGGVAFATGKAIAVGAWTPHVARAAFVLISQYALFYYLSQGSVLIGTLLFATTGLFLPVVTYFAFGMQIRRRTIAAIILSFAGVAVVLDPAAQFEWTMLIGLAAGFFNSCSQATQHYTSKHGSALSAAVIMFALASAGSLVVAVATGGVYRLADITGFDGAGFEGAGGAHTIFIVLGVAVATISNQLLRARAYRIVNKPASLAPFLYASVVYAGLFEWLFYGIVPTWNVYAGTALVFFGAVIMAWRGKVGPTRVEHAA